MTSDSNCGTCCVIIGQFGGNCGVVDTDVGGLEDGQQKAMFRWALCNVSWANMWLLHTSGLPSHVMLDFAIPGGMMSLLWPCCAIGIQPKDVWSFQSK